jgi:hypothetical protein
LRASVGSTEASDGRLARFGRVDRTGFSNLDGDLGRRVGLMSDTWKSVRLPEKNAGVILPQPPRRGHPGR